MLQNKKLCRQAAWTMPSKTSQERSDNIVEEKIHEN